MMGIVLAVFQMYGPVPSSKRFLFRSISQPVQKKLRVAFTACGGVSRRGYRDARHRCECGGRL